MKKIFAVAVATVMTVAMSVSAFAETKSDLTVAGAFSANTGEEVLEGDFDVTYTFHHKGYLEKNDKGESVVNAWDTFIVELTTVGIDGKVAGTDANYASIVIGNQNQWWFNDASAKTQWAGTFTSSYSDADLSKKVLADADVVCNIKRVGEKLTIKATATGAAGEATYSLEVENTAGFGNKVNLHLTGEDCELTNIKFVDNKKAPATGDFTAVLPVALVAVAAMTVVVVMKKRTVAE